MEEENRHPAWLREHLHALKRGQFSSKSERWETEEQMSLFNESDMESKNPDQEKDEGNEIEVEGQTKKRGRRKGLPSNLPRAW